MRYLALLGALALAACEPAIPDSGVGFGNYDDYQARQEAAANAARARGKPPPSQTTIVPPPPDAIKSAIAEAQTEPTPPAAPGPQITLNNPGISQEQDFDTVSQQRDIAADAERLAAARQQYQLVTPTELQRPGDTGPNIFQYALSTRHPIGTKLHRRSLFGAGNAPDKCAGYRTADVAQEEFLAAGGPKRDRLGLDPDGDGYACAWDPAIYRGLVQN